MIEIDNLHKSYRTADGRVSEVLKGLSLRVPTRSITAVVGPSGAGKSTLARLISLLERPDSGSIRVNGNDLSLLSGERCVASGAPSAPFFSPPRCSAVKRPGRISPCRWNISGWLNAILKPASANCWRAWG
jgi:ABC-type oligopeptide transport system ATPase subunit